MIRLHCTDSYCTFMTPMLSEDKALTELQNHVTIRHPVDQLTVYSLNYSSLRDGETLLHRSAAVGMKQRCEDLIKRGAQVDATDYGYDTPLIYAAEEGHTDVCQMLLDCGAELRYKNRLGDTALSEAARKGSFDTCQLLLSRGALVDAANNKRLTLLIKAAIHGHTEVCELFLDHGADVLHKHDGGDSPLDCAALNGHLQTCKLLVSRGADGDKALMKCLSDNNFKIASCLIEEGADLDWIKNPRWRHAFCDVVAYFRRKRYEDDLREKSVLK